MDFFHQYIKTFGKKLNKYLITDPLFYGSCADDLSASLDKALNIYKVDLICLRDKQNTDLESLAKIFLKITKQYSIKKTFINSHIDLANKFGFFGVHLNSAQLDKIEYAKSLGLYVICSTHSLKETKICEYKGADAITFSPIFKVKNKEEPKGILALKSICANTTLDVYALGGITTNKHLLALKNCDIKGFASIRYFI